MENKIVGKFTAKTFDNKVYEFIVKEDGYIYWDLLPGKKIKRFILKPKFELCIEGNEYRILDNKSSLELVETYFISTELLKFLIKNNRIMYSVDMSYLYDIEEKYGYDRYEQKRAFKRVKDKTKILSKQKQGIFN